MAKRNKRTTPTFVGFAAADLTDHDIQELSEVNLSVANYNIGMAEDFISLGYKFDVTWVADEDVFCASLIGNDIAMSHNAGVKVTAKAPSMIEAILVLDFKLDKLGKGQWPVNEGGSKARYR